MSFHTLATAIMAFIFSTSMSFNFFQTRDNQDAFIFHSSNQSLALFMPVDSLIVSEVTSSNDESC